MKKLYLIYNDIQRNYIFVSGPNPYSDIRETWNISDSGGLLGKLKDKIDPKRKSVLHLVKIPSEAQKRIVDFFEKTKIRVSID